jgi:TRAP-type C4-dicarboxylate transport system substrate-binding protein
MANGIGSLVVARRFYQDLPQDLQKLLKSTGAAIGERLVTETRRENAEALELLRKKGMKFVLNPEDLDTAEVAEISRNAGNSLMRSGYIPKTVIDNVNTWLSEYRTKSKPENVSP